MDRTQLPRPLSRLKNEPEASYLAFLDWCEQPPEVSINQFSAKHFRRCGKKSAASVRKLATTWQWTDRRAAHSELAAERFAERSLLYRARAMEEIPKRYERIYEAAMTAYDLSVAGKRISTNVVEAIPALASKPDAKGNVAPSDGKPRPARFRNTTKTLDVGGNPAFLSIALDALKAERELYGMDAPSKQVITATVEVRTNQLRGDVYRVIDALVRELGMDAAMEQVGKLVGVLPPGILPRIIETKALPAPKAPTRSEAVPA